MARCRLFPKKPCPAGLPFNKRLVFLFTETETKPLTMNTHLEITLTKGKQSENYLNKKVGLYAQIGRINQPDNREINVLVHMPRR